MNETENAQSSELEAEEDCNSESDSDKEGTVLQNVTSIESVLSNHSVSCLAQKFTWLPCAAHKVLSKPVVSLILFLTTARFILCLVRVLTPRLLPSDCQYRRLDASLSSTESPL